VESKRYTIGNKTKLLGQPLEGEFCARTKHRFSDRMSVVLRSIGAV